MKNAKKNARKNEQIVFNPIFSESAMEGTNLKLRFAKSVIRGGSMTISKVYLSNVWYCVAVRPVISTVAESSRSSASATTKRSSVHYTRGTVRYVSVRRRIRRHVSFSRCPTRCAVASRRSSRCLRCPMMRRAVRCCPLRSNPCRRWRNLLL